MVINIDFFYDKLRADVYQKRHGYHFLLIYGYDSENRTFNIIDHNHANSYYYDDFVMDFETLIECYNGYRENIGNQGEYTFSSYYKIQENCYMPDFYYQKKNFKTLVDNVDLCMQGIEYLDEFIRF